MLFDEIPHFHVEVDSPRIEHGLSIMIHILRAIHKEIKNMSDNIDPVYQALADSVAQTQSTAVSAITLLNGLHQKLDAALANAASDPHAALAAVKAAVDALGVSRQALADAVLADGLPVDPIPVTPPVPPVEPEVPAPSTEPQPEPTDGALPPSEPPLVS